MSLYTNIEKVVELLEDVINSKLTARKMSNTSSNNGPLIIGLTGLQGSGKSTWATGLVDIFTNKHQLKAIQISLDDLYRTHKGLVKLREDNSKNGLLRTRGQPGTHDEELARNFFTRLRNREPGLCVPVFDKSLFKGQGDRLSESEWPAVPENVDVVIFEGWCVGFRNLGNDEIERKRSNAQKLQANSNGNPKSTVTLPDHDISHLVQVNQNLERYCASFMGPQYFDAFVHLDTDDLVNVYSWRLGQEHALIKAKGTGMSDDEVVAFIRGYMPAYELYLDDLRKGFFAEADTSKRHIRVLLGLDREVISVQRV